MGVFSNETTDSNAVSLNFHLPDGIYNSTKPKDSEPRTTTISFQSDVEWDDFYDQVCDTMALSCESAQIGWKDCDEKKREPYHRLGNAGDLYGAFEMHCPMLLSNHRIKPVYVKVTDLVRSFLLQLTKLYNNIGQGC